MSTASLWQRGATYAGTPRVHQDYVPRTPPKNRAHFNGRDEYVLARCNGRDAGKVYQAKVVEVAAATEWNNPGECRIVRHRKRG